MQNEQGFYMGLQFTPLPYWKIALYGDWFRFPWVKYGVDGAVHAIGVERVEQRLMRPWFRGDDMAGGRVEQLLRFRLAGVAHDVPVVELGLEIRIPAP